MRFADVTRTLLAAERLLLPPECLLCHEAVEESAGDSLVCELCQSRWRKLPEPVCSRCGQPLDPGISCRICEAWPGALQRVRSAVWFDGSVRGAIHQLKYEGWWRVADVAARSMRRLEPLEPGVVLVPVPLAPQRLRRRGYNQSERIARALGTGSGLHGVRVKFTRPNGAVVWIDSAAVVSVRAALVGEYAPGVLSVITVGRMRQGVCENLARTRAILRGHGARV